MCISLFVNGFYRGLCYQEYRKRGSRRLISDSRLALGIREFKVTTKLRFETNFKLDFIKKDYRKKA